MVKPQNNIVGGAGKLDSAGVVEQIKHIHCEITSWLLKMVRATSVSNMIVVSLPSADSYILWQFLFIVFCTTVYLVLRDPEIYWHVMISQNPGGTPVANHFI